MFSKFEMFGAGMSVFFMALALYLVQVQSTLFKPLEVGLPAQAISAQNSGVVVVGQSDDVEQARADAYLQAMNDNGTLVLFSSVPGKHNTDSVVYEIVNVTDSSLTIQGEAGIFKFKKH